MISLAVSLLRDSFCALTVSKLPIKTTKPPAHFAADGLRTNRQNQLFSVDQTHDQRYQKYNQENVKKYFGDFNSTAGDTAETKNGGNNGDDKKGGCPSQHDDAPLNRVFVLLIGYRSVEYKVCDFESRVTFDATLSQKSCLKLRLKQISQIIGVFFLHCQDQLQHSASSGVFVADVLNKRAIAFNGNALGN